MLVLWLIEPTNLPKIGGVCWSSTVKKLNTSVQRIVLLRGLNRSTIMTDLIKPGFARKAVIDRTKGIRLLPKVIFTNKYVQDFLFYVILISGILIICSLFSWFGWDTFVVDCVINHQPMSFV